MSDIVIFNEDSQSLGEVSFIKNTASQLKIRNADSYALTKEISHFITHATNRLGIKEATSKLDKSDILELVLTKYKNLSFDEIYYAFKMERHGYLGERIQHFQLFNAEYVSSVLDKYVPWKRQKMFDHKISIQKAQEEKEISKEEKQYWINLAVMECFFYYEETMAIMDGKTHNVYEILYDLDYLPKDVAYKQKMYKSAVEVLQMEYSTKKASSRDEKKQIKQVLADIHKPKYNKAILKAKELVLMEFFRNTIKNPEKLKQFKETFKVVPLKK